MVPPAASNGGLTSEINYAIDAMKQLKVTELKEICRSIGLPLSGRKVNLQERITQYIKDSMSIGHIDPWRPRTIVLIISKILNSDFIPSYVDIWADVKSGKYPIPIGQILRDAPSIKMANPISEPTESVSQINNVNQKKSLNDIVPFKLTPFYNLQYKVAKSSYRLVKASGRGVGAVRFTFTGHEWLKLQSDSKKYRLCLFCWPVTSRYNSGSPKEYIEFPSPNEILFNGHKITENVRGLKNKPGTAKPADLSIHIRPPPQINTLDLIYAYTRSDFEMACFVTEIISPDELLKSVVLEHPRIARHVTLDYIKKTMSEEDEDDLITTSTILSLQCPISYSKMKYPAQSRSCKHLQCFDALWYLHSQMQIPTWQCPVCSINIPLENLVISEYVNDIIKNSDEEVEQVELSPDGSWKAFIEEETQAPANGTNNTDNVSSAPVKQEQSIDSANNIPSGEHADAVVISLDSSDDEDNMVTANESLEVPDTATFTPDFPNTNNDRPLSNRYSEENSDIAEADLPLSQYIRRNSNNMINAPAPILTSESLLGLGSTSQAPAMNGSLLTSQHEALPNVAALRNGNQSNPLLSSHSNDADQPSMSPNMIPINNSALFGASHDTRPPPPVNLSDRSNSILGIGGNLPNLNLPQNGLAPANPVMSTNTNNTTNISGRHSSINVDSPSPLPPLTNMFRRNSDNSTNPTNRPMAIPHSRRARNEISPFIPRKPYPPNRMAAIPRKRPDVGSNEPVNRGNPLMDNNAVNTRINPLTNRPYQENSNPYGDASSAYNINTFDPPILNLPGAHNSNDSDIVDLTSD